MARKRRRKKQRARKRSRPAVAQPAADRATLARLIEKGEAKTALERAKAAHKELRTAESEAVLTQTYVARVEELSARGMATEAVALLGLVRRRFPAAGERTAELELVLRVRQGDVDELLRPLADPGLPADRRAAIELLIRREATDLERLGQTAALPDDHPLKRAAAATATAFSAVTRGPVDRDAIALAEVSRRSPLAPWKMLVRAVEAFYRGDDDTCSVVLGAMERAWSDGSAPLRTVPVLRAMIEDTDATQLSRAATDLRSRVTGRGEIVREHLEKLDDAFASKDLGRTLGALRKAIRVARTHAPGLMARLRQHASVRGFLAGLPMHRIHAALGGPLKPDAYFWRLLARACEVRRVRDLACAAWEQYRRHAVAEGSFAVDSPEAAAVDLRMAEVLAPLDAEDLEELREEFVGFPGFDALSRPGIDGDVFRPERLFERSIRGDSDPETFRQWLAWSRSQRPWQETDKVALRWHEAFPDDTEPLLYLTGSAEKRGAFKKALGFLEAAEELDSLRPEVRRARQRLLLATARRHLRQRKPHLVDKDVAALAGLPRMQSGDGPLVLAALGWATALERGDDQQADEHREGLERELESETAVLLVLGGLAEAVRLRQPRLPRKPPRSDRGQLTAAVARATDLADALGVAVEIPQPWSRVLIREVESPKSSWTPGQLLNLTAAALASQLSEVAYAASGAGLGQGGPHRARFLLLRARSLPIWTPYRTAKALEAAVELARRGRDFDLISEAVELSRGRRRLPGFLLGRLAMEETSLSGEELEAVLRREQEAREYPKDFGDDDEPDWAMEPDRAGPDQAGPDWDDEDGWDDDELDFDPFCDCPGCTRRRLELGLDAAPLEDEPEDEGLAYPLELTGLPPPLLRLMMEATLKYGGPGGMPPEPETVERLDPELFEKIQAAFLEYEAGGGALPRRPAPRRKKRRRGKRR